jgi:hypothetical protein
MKPDFGYLGNMAWNSLIVALIAAAAGLLGVGYGARLSRGGETLSWTRDQRLKTYLELLSAIEKCYEAFTLIDASLNLAQYKESAKQDPRVRGSIAEWGKWDEATDRCLPQTELVCSRHLQPYVMYLRLGLRSRQRMLLMKLDYGQGINPEEWKFVSSKTHGEILVIRQKLRDDITYLDPVPNLTGLAMRRFKVLRCRPVTSVATGAFMDRRHRPSSRRSIPQADAERDMHPAQGGSAAG